MQIDVERKYVGILFASVAAIYTLLILLFNKYYDLTFSYLLSLCKIAVIDFLSSRTHIIGLAILAILFTGGFLFTVRVLVTYIKTRKRINKLVVLKTNKNFLKLQSLLGNMSLKSSQIIVVETREHIALNYGLIRPKIVLSSGLIKDLSKKELEAVILHELYHQKRSHVLLFLLAETSRSLLFFVPVIGTLVNNIKLKSEIRADDYAAEFQGTKKYLRMALVKTLNSTPYIYLYPNFSSSLLEQRVTGLTSKELIISVSRREVFYSSIVILLLVGMFLIPNSAHAHTDYSEFNGQSSCENTQTVRQTLITNMTPAF
jgi:Zn-dependent protease with chaperone function